ncbi:uncharacterized protein LOC134206811 [Armigeres subalbatus]|uniref:uncharacterized protein LOC134206811 n=1 Tax=Armigeres subalbatus TaxID=124917 RepID=UPI002ED5D8D6
MDLLSLAIRYQSSSPTDPNGVDNCGAYKKFNRTQNIAIECNSDESNMPGSFCMKVVHQSPRGFLWDGDGARSDGAPRYRKLVSPACNWGVYENIELPVLA